MGILILYVPPWWRDAPVKSSERLAIVAVKRPAAALAYVTVVFIVLPLIGVAVFR